VKLHLPEKLLRLPDELVNFTAFHVSILLVISTKLLFIFCTGPYSPSDLRQKLGQFIPVLLLRELFGTISMMMVNLPPH
jgi:hypothetical protein